MGFHGGLGWHYRLHRTDTTARPKIRPEARTGAAHSDDGDRGGDTVVTTNNGAKYSPNAPLCITEIYVNIF
jgi:hypothetical protein